MNEMEFKPNSHKYRETKNATPPEEKRVEKVVTGTVKTKKNLGRKLADTFIAEDIKDVKSYIFTDVLVPAAKKAIVDMTTEFVSRMFGTGIKKPTGFTNASYVSYNQFSSPRPVAETKPKIGFRYDDIVLSNRGDAENVLTCLIDAINQYGAARIADLYDLVGITDDNYTTNNYGWKDLSNAGVIRVSDGYKLTLPRAVALNR